MSRTADRIFVMLYLVTRLSFCLYRTAVISTYVLSHMYNSTETRLG